MDFWWGSRILSTRDLGGKVMIWGAYQELNQKDRSYRIEATGYRIEATGYRIQGYKDARKEGYMMKDCNKSSQPRGP